MNGRFGEYLSKGKLFLTDLGTRTELLGLDRKSPISTHNRINCKTCNGRCEFMGDEVLMTATHLGQIEERAMGGRYSVYRHGDSENLRIVVPCPGSGVAKNIPTRQKGHIEWNLIK